MLRFSGIGIGKRRPLNQLQAVSLLGFFNEFLDDVGHVKSFPALHR
jgi:hypothetical protein